MAASFAGSSSSRDYIPLEIIEMILPHLPLNAQIRFQTVCKDWKKVIKPYMKKIEKVKDPGPVPLIVQMSGAADWLHGEMKAGETVSQTQWRMRREAFEWSDAFGHNLVKLKVFNENLAMMKLWQGDIESKTEEEVAHIVRDIDCLAVSI